MGQENRVEVAFGRRGIQRCTCIRVTHLLLLHCIVFFWDEVLFLQVSPSHRAQVPLKEREVRVPTTCSHDVTPARDSGRELGAVVLPPSDTMGFSSPYDITGFLTPYDQFMTRYFYEHQLSSSCPSTFGNLFLQTTYECIFP